ncbi:hypothetical protein CDD83_656 [Cordyceps sp. RAO-2017]|nr:hypothetical protein CDD83_656 [Cordyceps sp. RAO-2017]
MSSHRAPSETPPSLAPAALDEAEASSQHARQAVPPRPIPATGAERLSQATETAPDSDRPEPQTVLYLAYGSNMAAATFLGMRGIRPLSQINVSVPSLRLTFSLRGVPYWEPCFANVGFRDLPFRDLPDKAAGLPETHREGAGWDGSLMGVVYEVTAKDYRTILRTEGAGSSYKEIVVPCIPIKNKLFEADKAKPFLAKTLYAPHNDDDDDDDGRCCRRLRAVTQRPVSSRGRDSQPSARYLKLLRDGAGEHGLPESYQAYLASLQPFVKTHWRQKMGQSLLLLTWAPLLMAFFKTTHLLADETGRLPKWLAAAMNMVFGLMWINYEAILKPLFGDGERTERDEGSRDGGPIRRQRLEGKADEAPLLSSDGGGG